MDFMFSYSNLTTVVVIFNVLVMFFTLFCEIIELKQVDTINEKIEYLTNKNELLVKENEEICKKIEENNIKYDNENKLFDNVFRELEKKIQSLEYKIVKYKMENQITEESNIECFEKNTIIEETNIECFEQRIHKIEHYVMQIKQLLVNSEITPDPAYKVNSYDDFFEAFEHIENESL